MARKPSLAVGANAGRSRLHNRQVVLGQVRAAGRIGRAEMARRSGLTTQAVSNIIAELEADGLIRQTERISVGRGHPTLLYALDPKGGYALGVELRPDALWIALLDLGGTAVYQARAPLAQTDPASVLAALEAARAEAMARSAIQPDRLLGAGIVMPGPYGRTGVSGMDTELDGWQEIDLEPFFAEALDLPVIVENDANAAAVAERVSGVARGLQTYAFCYFGAGVGLGLVSNGRLERGAFGNAGEIGHMLVSDGCGALVPLETRAGRLSLRARLGAAGIRAERSEDLAALYAKGEPVLTDWLDQAAAPLSHAFQIIENLWDPETIILGGAMPDDMLDHLISRADLSDRSVSHRAERRLPRLMRSGSGRLTATLGAAALVINQTFTPEIAQTD